LFAFFFSALTNSRHDELFFFNFTINTLGFTTCYSFSLEKSY